MNVIRLVTPTGTVVSALSFDTAVIPLLIPVALHGVRHWPVGSAELLRRNLLGCGVGGAVAPFVGRRAP